MWAIPLQRGFTPQAEGTRPPSPPDSEPTLNPVLLGHFILIFPELNLRGRWGKRVFQGRAFQTYSQIRSPGGWRGGTPPGGQLQEPVPQGGHRVHLFLFYRTGSLVEFLLFSKDPLVKIVICIYLNPMGESAW